MLNSSPWLKTHQLEQYREDGFLVVEELLDAEEVESVKSTLTELVRTYGPDRSQADLVPEPEDRLGGGIRIKRKDSDFFFQLERGQEPALDDPSRLELQIRKFMSFADEAPIFRKILGPESRMLQICGELIGDTALLYQSQALIKPPKIGSTKPWHQDNAYFAVSPLESVCGVWIAIDEATVENGCMHMLKGQHKNGALRHEHKRDCEINVRQLDLKTLVPVPLKPGGALFFSGMIPHETPPNRSDRRRRALQFHFRGSQSQILPGPDYDAVFKDANGQPASCEALRRRGA